MTSFIWLPFSFMQQTIPLSSMSTLTVTIWFRIDSFNSTRERDLSLYTRDFNHPKEKNHTSVSPANGVTIFRFWNVTVGEQFTKNSNRCFAGVRCCAIQLELQSSTLMSRFLNSGWRKISSYKFNCHTVTLGLYKDLSWSSRGFSDDHTLQFAY